MQGYSSIYDFTFPAIGGDEIRFSEFRGKKILIVNTASECMYTVQFAHLQELHQNFSDKIVIVGFPSNDFGEQEPGSNIEIKNFCKYRYGVTFPLAEKSSVIGKDANPVFKFLTSLDFKNDLNKTITWNFQKFLLDETGKLITVFPPATEPINDEMMSYITSAIETNS
ncbi:MAG: glutathione peroxidase [Chitinophagales bacterium]